MRTPVSYLYSLPIESVLMFMVFQECGPPCPSCAHLCSLTSESVLMSIGIPKFLWNVDPCVLVVHTSVHLPIESVLMSIGIPKFWWNVDPCFPVMYTSAPSWWVCGTQGSIFHKNFGILMDINTDSIGRDQRFAQLGHRGPHSTKTLGH